MKRLLMVVNPHAGKQHFKGKLLDLIDICTRQGYDTTVLTTQGRGDAAGMVRERAALYEKIICCGGDGTLNEVISGLMACPPQARPPLGYIPAGTTNDLAATLGIDRDPFAACRDIFSGTEIPYDIGSFNEDRCFSYIAAFGAFTEVSYQTPQPLKNTLGHFAYLLEGTRRLSELHPYRMQVRHDGGTIEGDFIFGAVCNTRSIGGLLRFDRRDADPADGLFELLLVRMPRSIADLSRILAGLHSRRFDEDAVIFLHTAHAAFLCREDTAWSLDGEDGGAHRRCQIRNNPGAVRFLYDFTAHAAAQRQAGILNGF